MTCYYASSKIHGIAREINDMFGEAITEEFFNNDLSKTEYRITADTFEEMKNDLCDACISSTNPFVCGDGMAVALLADSIRKSFTLIRAYFRKHDLTNLPIYNDILIIVDYPKNYVIS